LVDFGLSTNPEALLLFSKHKFGKLVREKAMNYAFKTLLDTKLKHSKMRFLEYSEFKRQNYFNLPGIGLGLGLGKKLGFSTYLLVQPMTPR